MERKPDIVADLIVDARGLRCPEPLMVVRNKLMDLASGQLVEVYATDPSTSWDFPNFCKFLGHELVAAAEMDQDGEHEYHYWIRKK